MQAPDKRLVAGDSLVKLALFGTRGHLGPTPPSRAMDNNRLYGPSQLRVFTTQLVLLLVLGASTFLLFCVLRRRWPHMYAVRTLRRKQVGRRPLPTHLFAWVPRVWAISDEEVLEYSGLDAYVVLCFFKMGVKIFSVLALVGLLVLSPVRYYFTGNYDKDDMAVAGPPLDQNFAVYLWVYPVFTYLFSVVVFAKLFQHTLDVIRTRQKYLALQNLITDRTIKLDGIPKRFVQKNDPAALKRFVEDLGIGRVVDVKLLYDWSPLLSLFDRRNSLVRRLERLYSRYFGLNVDLYNDKAPRVLPMNAPEQPGVKTALRRQIDDLARLLVQLDREIARIQDKYDPSTSTMPTDEGFDILPSAFVTMDSVALAQMAAQTVLDPRVYKLQVLLAPAAKDINWQNLKVSYGERTVKLYMITFAIILSYTVIFFLVTSLSTLLDVKTISKFWPQLGQYIADSKWLSTFVTGVLPPVLFSLMNILFPYLYKYLTQHQGYSLSSEVEMLTLSKNFFFIFFILFLVFTITGTLWDYITSIGDTTRFAAQLAESLKKLLLFYVDLILLQGLAMFPVRLLQIGDFVILNVIGKLFLLKNIFLRTPRDYRFFYYTPPVFDFGLNLPQHILIFIIILIYSVVSTKIVTSGLVYFAMGYFVYKYQLVYSFVHPPHSTGKVWLMIFRRLIFGIFIFQVFMCGTLALEGAILLLVLCTPLFVVTAMVAWHFERYYVPLHNFIALRAIHNPLDYDRQFDDDTLLVADHAVEMSPGTPLESLVLLEGDFLVSYSAGMLRHKRKISTVDEEREQFTDYTYPYIRDPLDGPWIGFDGDFILMVEYREQHSLESGNGQYECVLSKQLALAEWE